MWNAISLVQDLNSCRRVHFLRRTSTVWSLFLPGWRKRSVSTHLEIGFEVNPWFFNGIRSAFSVGFQPSFRIFTGRTELFTCSDVLLKLFKCSNSQKTFDSFYRSKKPQMNKSLWIELPRPENPPNTYAQYTETLNSCFDLIRSHQQCTPWSPISDDTLQCRNSTTEPPVHIANKWRQIQFTILITLLKNIRIWTKVYSDFFLFLFLVLWLTSVNFISVQFSHFI